MALVLGLVLAFMISKENLLLAIVVVFIVPAMILFNRYPLAALMVWLLLMPFLQSGWVSASIFWIVHRSLPVLALGINILSRLLRLKKYPSVPWGPAEWSMIFFLALGTVSVLLTQPNPRLYLFSLYDSVFVSFVLYWVIRLLNSRIQDLKRLMPVFMVICIAEIVMGFWAWLAPHSLPWLFAFPRMDPDRMSGTFSNPNPYAYVLLFCIMFLFYYAMNSKEKLIKVLALSLFGVGLVCIFLTFTRACWLAALPVLLGLLFMYPRPILLLILGITAVIPFLAGDVVMEQFAFAGERLNSQDTAEDRVILAYAGQQMFYAKPFFGWGYASYDQHDWKFMERVGDIAPTEWDIKKGRSHNTYITILAEIGAVGFFFYFFPVIWWLILTLKVWPHIPKEGFWSRRWLVMMWLSILSFIIIAQVVDMRYFWFSLGLWRLTLGFIGNMVQTYEQPDNMAVSVRI